MLIPAALGEVLTGDNADEVQAGVVVEAANYPVTPTATRSSHDRASRSSPTSSPTPVASPARYFEWTQNIQQFTWDEAQFNQRLAARLLKAYAATREMADYLECTLRSGAYAIGIRRVAEAVELRGYI